MENLSLMSGETCDWFVGRSRRGRGEGRPKEEGVVIRAGDEKLWSVAKKVVESFFSEFLCYM